MTEFKNSFACVPVKLYMIQLPSGCETRIKAIIMALPSVLPERRGKIMANVSFNLSILNYL